MTWSVRPRQRPQPEPRQSGSSRGATPLALLLAGALLAPGLIQAPDAAAATCDIPVAGNAQTTAARAAATPDAGGSGIIEIEGAASAATPATLPAATPIAPEADSLEVLGEELTNVAESLAACLTAGDARMVTELAGERYLGQIFGSSVPLSAADYRAIASELSPVSTRILTVEEVTQPAENRATAVVTQVVGNQVLRAEWTFVPAERGERKADRNPWKLSFERTLPAAAPRGAQTIEVEIQDLAFSIDPVQIAGPDLVLRGSNVSSEDHEMLVLRLEDGMTTSGLLRAAGPALPSGVVFVGEIPVRAGHEQDLVLVDLDPGTYTIVCLFPDADGVPHLALGMEAAFTVG